MYLSRFCRDESLSSPRERYGRASLSNKGVKQLKGPLRITGDSYMKKKAGGQTEVNFSCTCAPPPHTEMCRHTFTHTHTPTHIIHTLSHIHTHSYTLLHTHTCTHTHIHTHAYMTAPTSPQYTEASAPLVGSSLMTIIWLLLGKEQSSPELYRTVKG